MPGVRGSAAGRLFALASVVVFAASCSNAEPTVNKRPHAGVGTASPVAGVQQITVTTGPDLRFHPSTLVVHQGKVRIMLVNKIPASGGPPHNLQVTGFPAADIPLVQPGQTGSMTFIAPAPGRYRFICSIHLRQGQTGVLIVEKGTAG